MQHLSQASQPMGGVLASPFSKALERPVVPRRTNKISIWRNSGMKKDLLFLVSNEKQEFTGSKGPNPIDYAEFSPDPWIVTINQTNPIIQGISTIHREQLS